MWTEVENVATGWRGEQEDLRAKLCATEVHEDELNGGDFSFDYDGDPTFSSLDNEHFFKEFGVLDFMDEACLKDKVIQPWIFFALGTSRFGRSWEETGNN